MDTRATVEVADKSLYQLHRLLPRAKIEGTHDEENAFAAGARTTRARASRIASTSLVAFRPGVGVPWGGGN